MKYWRILSIIGLITISVVVRGSSPKPLLAKNPTWVVGEHPRLLATAGERAALTAKLTANGTTSEAMWSYFTTHNIAYSTNAYNLNYADAGVLYWINGTAAAGQQAHDAVMNYVSAPDNIFTPTIASYELGFWRYRDMLLNFDFAYDRFTPAERQQIYTRILLQGTKCHNAGPSWAPGNINALWGLCEYASAVMLEGENFSVTVTDEAVLRQAGTKDLLLYPTNASNISIRTTPGGPVTYVAGTDYTTCNSSYYGDRCIDWSPSGTEPATNTTYYVSYTVQPMTDMWRAASRMFLEDHLNYHWRDGTYTGGFDPYSGAALESVIDMIEIARRDMGVDYSEDVDLKHYIDMAIYERLPYSGANGGYGFDMLSDSGNKYEDAMNHPREVGFTYRGWVERMVAYGLSRYGNDPEYRDKYLWVWSQYYRNTDGTIKQYFPGIASDWREAWYFNDQVAGSYPVTTIPTPSWPTYQFFRGRDLVIARTDHFDTPNVNAAYVSLFAQNHNHQIEHDQGDSGSFTFYSNQEDWAIDPGYQQSFGGSGGSSPDHNTVGIDGSGYNATGIYGQQNTSPVYGGFSHIEHVALSDGASAMKADLSHAWSLTTSPFVDHQYRYLAMVNGTEQSYVVVGDDIKKDASAHSYQWYFSTGPGNTVTRAGNVATVTGARNQAVMDIHTITPVTNTTTIEDWSAGNMAPSPYKRLTITAPTVVNPYFLNLLIPTATGNTKPTVSQAVVTNGVRANVTWPDGAVDAVYWRIGNGNVQDGTVNTDGALTILRTVANVVTGLVLFDGRTVTRSGATIYQATDGQQPTTFSSFDTSASVSGADTSRVRVRLPGITNAHIADGTYALDVAHVSGDTYLTAGLPFDEAAQQSGQLLSESFDSTYVHNLVFPNIQRYSPTALAVNNGALDLQPTWYDFLSLSRRDSTQWRRSNLTPSAIPADSFGDADYSFKYRFTDTTTVGRKFRAYFRVQDRNAVDWYTNQDYVRLDIDPIAGQVTLGQRVNGSWADIADNDVLTSTTATIPVSLNDTAWHTIALRIQGGQARVQIDGAMAFTGAVVGALPSAGYIQWRVIGSTHVQLDDVRVTAIDSVVPVAPSGGSILPQASSGVVTMSYTTGLSPDSAALHIYHSASVITPQTDPATLTLVTQGTNLQTATIPVLDRTGSYAALVSDTAGNQSALAPLQLDTTSPGTVANLQAQ